MFGRNFHVLPAVSMTSFIFRDSMPDVSMQAFDASKVRVYGPAVEAPVKTFHKTYLIIDCKEAGQGMLYVQLCVGNCQSVMSS